MTVPTLTSRKLIRQRLATLIDEITTLVAVYDHETKDFERKSPIATVHSDGSMTTFPDYTREFHRFWITIFWARTDDDFVEDYTDDLAAAVRQKLIDNLEEPGYWHDIHFDEEFSEMDYVIIDGVMYRRERWRITVYAVEAFIEFQWLPLSTNLTYDFIASPTYLFQNNDGTNPVTAFGQTVLSWQDRIAAALLVASTGAKYQTENSQDALEFLDANERYTGTGLDAPEGARTYQMVVSSALTFGSGPSILFYHASSVSQIAGSFKWGGDDDPQLFLSATLHKSWQGNPEPLDGEIHIVTLTLPSADVAGLQAAKLYIDGVERTDTEEVITGGVAAWTDLGIGGGSSDYFGHLYRILVYDEVLDDNERQLNEAGLADLYDVVLG